MLLVLGNKTSPWFGLSFARFVCCLSVGWSVGNRALHFRCTTLYNQHLPSLCMSRPLDFWVWHIKPAVASMMNHEYQLFQNSSGYDIDKLTFWTVRFVFRFLPWINLLFMQNWHGKNYPNIYMAYCYMLKDWQTNPLTSTLETIQTSILRIRRLEGGRGGELRLSLIPRWNSAIHERISRLFCNLK